MNKRGTHVGVIASFSIFIVFVVVLYVIMEPALKTQKDKDLFLEYLELKLIDEFSSNLTTITVSNASGSDEFFNIPKNDLTLDYVNSNYIVKDKDENIIVSENSGLSNLKISAVTENVLWIYFANVTFTIKTGVGESTSRIYKIESIRETKEIFEEKILEGLNDFESLKGNMSIPLGIDFSLVFEKNNGTQIRAGEKNVTTSIYANEIPIYYINVNASKLAGKLITKVW
ncbi:MAG: hypothetical protein ABIH59_02450 [archaeon]